MTTWNNVDDLLAVASIEIARSLCPQGWDEVPLSQEPGTYANMMAHWHRTGKIAVAEAAAFGSGEKRLWGDAAPWQAFFVWHDRCHVMVPDSFDPEGEAKVHDLQVAHLHAWARRRGNVNPAALMRSEAVLAAHNLGRLEHWRYHGGQPDDLREFTYGYLAALRQSQPHPLYLNRS